ncbi:MAG: sigma-54-dependent Fis family transcriptional regulator [wastewater metagenome]|nr:sigma-54-dependent Fis family transcriptional regulator [Candidatus Loosdrechtia aerotolerans]
MITNGDSKILIIDDEIDLCDMISYILTKEGYTTYVANDGNAGLETFHKIFPHVVILDLCMPVVSGIEILKKVKETNKEVPVIIITAYGEIRSAIEAIKLGAYDYFTKPFDNEQIVLVVKRAIEERSIRQEIHTLRTQFSLAMPLFEQMGSSAEIERINELVDRVAPTNFTVLIYGETGSGKELVARNIHNRSPRRDKPFIVVDCGSIPETLIESELFGFEKGTFTGAEQKKIGQFEVASGGTIFLDEIGNLPKSMQGKLLRVLQERRIRRLGGNKEIKVDVRIIAAGNERLELLVESGNFRMDLYQRLNEFCVEVPALKQRKDDIVFLSKRFLDITNKELNKNVRGVSREALEVLLSHDWPGNVRELKNVIRRAVLLAREVIEPKHLTIKTQETKQQDSSMMEWQSDMVHKNEDCTISLNLDINSGRELSFHAMVNKCVEVTERKIIEEVLKQTNGNKSRAAKILKIDYKTMHYEAKKYGIKVRTKTEIITS